MKLKKKILSSIILIFIIILSTFSSASTINRYIDNDVEIINGEINFKVNDRLGNDKVKLNENQLIGESNTLPYGQQIKSSNLKFVFNDKELDETGNYYFNARYYNYDSGKFLGVDPVSDNHAYAFVSNNPMNYVDPSGENFFSYLKEEWTERVIEPASNKLLEIAGDSLLPEKIQSEDAFNYMGVCAIAGNAGPQATIPDPADLATIGFLTLGVGLFLQELALNPQASPLDNNGIFTPLFLSRTEERAEAKDAVTDQTNTNEEGFNRMRVQIQVGDNMVWTDSSVPLTAPSDNGVTTLEVRVAMEALYYKSEEHMNKKFTRKLRSAIIEASQKLKNYPPEGTMEPIPSNFANFEYKGKEYRIDIENIQGWNLRQ